MVIDTAFLFLELISGYIIGSLALIADSFHMLNDVLSLVVALYTIKLATSPSSSANSYGWQRAEILGALINGVFLLALCVSIALEALGRFISPPEISNPKIIVIVGSLGLLSNIVGLFLFHEHGHSHGHSHGPVALPSEDGETTPKTGRRERSDSMSSLYQHPAQTRAQVIETAHEFGYGRDGDSSLIGAMSPPTTHHRAGSLSKRAHGSISRPRGHRHGSGPTPLTTDVGSSASTNTAIAEVSPGIKAADAKHNGHSHKHAKDVNAAEQGGDSHDHAHGHEGHDHGENRHDHGDDDGHGHSHGGHGHSHGSMNMQGVFLHVMGDALGNVGVIATGLVIWFCSGKWTLYFDPGVSLFITCIIFSSAMPLVKSASYILMQAVPSHVSLDGVRNSVRSVPGVVSVHELHVWQLSESTVVASVHVLIQPGVDYMEVASGIREGMHSHGIHSVTIQPEFTDGNSDAQSETDCLIRCPPEECGTGACCPPVNANTKLVDVEEVDDHAGHSH